MNDISKMLFLHFEKALIVVFGLALLYSIVFYGPWIGREDFSKQLQDLANQLDTRPLIGEDQVPAMPDLGRELPPLAVAEEKPVAFNDLWWPLEAREASGFLPPSQVAAEGSRGFIRVYWQVNPNQAPSDTIKPVGVEVERAVVMPDGLGKWEDVTVAANRQFYTTVDLFKLGRKYIPDLFGQEAQFAAVAPSARKGAKAKQPYTLEDIYNAWYDGRVTQAQAISAVREGVRRGILSAADQADFNEFRQSLPEEKRMIRMNAREAGLPAPRDNDLEKQILAGGGYHGGGSFGGAAVAITPGQPASPGEKKPAEAPVPPFENVNSFIDAGVSPDLEYVYHVRFWLKDITMPNEVEKPGDWGLVTSQVSSKPDTDFVLSGISTDQGLAIVHVRKWLSATSSWASHTYNVSPGEEIGRVETVSTGGSESGQNAGAAQSVDFSTNCVLLGFRYRPRSYDKASRKVTIDPLTQQESTLDKVDQVLYDTAQIVYSDRKGKLRFKWQTRGA